MRSCIEIGLCRSVRGGRGVECMPKIDCGFDAGSPPNAGLPRNLPRRKTWRQISNFIVNKHNCVLSNAGLSKAPRTTGICTSLKSDFYFRFQSPWSTESALLNFICTWDLVLTRRKCDNKSLNTAEIRIRTPLKLANYFRFVTQRTVVDATIFMSHMQNLVKIGKERIVDVIPK